MPTDIAQLRASSAFSSGNAAYLEALYEQYLADPASVPPHWRERFSAIGTPDSDQPHQPLRETLAREARARGPAICPSLSSRAAEKQAAVLRLINAYRVRGHQVARLDPLELNPPPEIPDLNPAFHHLGAEDMDATFNTGSLYGPERMTLREIIDFVKTVYCGAIGSEYMHITETAQKRWIQKRLEGYQARPELEPADRRWLLTLLTAAEGVEQYLHTRYVGQKRFSLEGGDALIPMLDEIIQRAGRGGMREIVIGMAHRGRLNVLTNILGKPPAEIFDEFEGRKSARGIMTAGDVKYHMGFSTDIDTPGGLVHVALGFNPSHLEIIDPVIEGSVHARQRRRNDHDGSQVLPLLLHGDSAFAGQGVVMETFSMSQTRGFHNGGTLHIVINNQIGFTTSNPLDTRSSAYCTDVGKMVQTPIFHVNGDDPEAVTFVTRLALDYRNRFHRDVIIDLVCYRRHGHNEADEPAVTQPIMYQKIRRHPTPRAIYAERLIAERVIAPDEPQRLIEEYRESIELGRVNTRPVVCGLKNPYAVDWSPYKDHPWDMPCDTRVAPDSITRLCERLHTLPEGFELHPRVEKIIEARRKMAAGDQMADWGFAEILAYATLLDQGYPVRLCGQDSGRGTFFHRHAKLYDQRSGEEWTPLRHLSESQPHVEVIDSLLSEEAVLGFEYGHATAEPNALTIWEAQFGDFANGAQVVIDQFISSAGAKWGLYCGLTLFLPHGQEGQGPEHSSARIERYMQLCAEHNIQVCVPTTPAQIFHLLRRQMIRPVRKPLVVMTPKSLLRHKLAVSSLDELAHGRFLPIIDESDEIAPPESVERVILCSGKVYYELLEARRARGLERIAIARIEQLYPFPRADFHSLVTRYPNARDWVWCQEEPRNQGAWDQIKHRFEPFAARGLEIRYAGRPISAAPAVGYYPLHLAQQEQLINQALDEPHD